MIDDNRDRLRDELEANFYASFAMFPQAEQIAIFRAMLAIMTGQEPVLASGLAQAFIHSLTGYTRALQRKKGGAR